MAYDIGPQIPRGAVNLLRLADILSEVRPEDYNHEAWGEKIGCRTVACAMGWAAASHEFGFDFVPSCFWTDQTGFYRFDEPHKKNVDPIELAVETFEVSFSDAEALFHFGDSTEAVETVRVRNDAITQLRRVAEAKIVAAVGA